MTEFQGEQRLSGGHEWGDLGMKTAPSGGHEWGDVSGYNHSKCGQLCG